MTASGAAPPHSHPREPYQLRVVAHSLGGASLLMYLVKCLKAGTPHHVHRLVLMSPAGWHKVRGRTRASVRASVHVPGAACAPPPPPLSLTALAWAGTA